MFRQLADDGVSVNSTQQHRPQEDVALPDEFETTGAKLVYLYLDVQGEATADELQAALGMKKTTLYPLLRTLTATGLVDRTGTEYATSERTTDGGES